MITFFLVPLLKPFRLSSEMVIVVLSPVNMIYHLTLPTGRKNQMLLQKKSLQLEVPVSHSVLTLYQIPCISMGANHLMRSRYVPQFVSSYLLLVCVE